MINKLSVVCQVVGFLAVLTGVLFLAPVPVGVVVDGALVLISGVLMEMSQRGSR